MTGHCERCPVAGGTACAGERVRRLCDLLRMGRDDYRPAIRAISAGAIAGPVGADWSAEVGRRSEIHRAARDCKHADKPWDGCACVDRLCRREGKIMSGLDCLVCAESGGTA